MEKPGCVLVQSRRRRRQTTRLVACPFSRAPLWEAANCVPLDLPETIKADAEKGYVLTYCEAVLACPGIAVNDHVGRCWQLAFLIWKKLLEGLRASKDRPRAMMLALVIDEQIKSPVSLLFKPPEIPGISHQA